MVEIEERVEPFSFCPVCECERYFLFEAPLDARDSLTWKGIGHYTLRGKKLEVRVCLNCGCIYVRNYRERE